MLSRLKPGIEIKGCIAQQTTSVAVKYAEQGSCQEQAHECEAMPQKAHI